MKKSLLFILFSFFLFLPAFGVFGAPSAKEDTLPPPEEEATQETTGPRNDYGGLLPCNGTDCNWNSLVQLAVNIINFFVWTLVPPVAGLLLLYGGIMFLTSGGNPGRVQQGRTIVTDVVIGLVIVYTSWLIVNTLLSVLTSGQQFL